MSDESKQANGGIPPKLDLRKPAAAPGGEPAPAAGGPGESPAAGKKKTTRIPLTPIEGETAAAAPTAALPKTIRLAAPPVGARPLTIPAGIPTGKPIAPSEAADKPKSQTSRIPLEAALAADQQAAAPAAPTGAPKTIRIKRPGQPSAAKTAAPAAAPQSAQATVAAVPEKSKTSRVDVAAAVAAPETTGQPTQRKTIKIRRAEVGVTAVPRSVAVARLEAEAAERHLEDISALGIGYSIVAAAAALVVCVLIYILMVQAFPTLNWTFWGKVV